MTNAASLAQQRAADPANSVWLSANAGSGKTRVLTDRVARLLLDGVPPQRLLCLTYTKAAASEMQNRLFDRLGAWVMMPEGQLKEELSALGADQENISDRILARARRLFAQAIETPGGLKIQTIHSFCSSILRQFPLEAGVSPNFKELDDRSAAALRLRVFEALAEREPEIVADFARFVTADTVDDRLKSIISMQGDLAKPFDETLLRDLLNLPAGATADDLAKEILSQGGLDVLTNLTPLLKDSGKRDQSLADMLLSLDFEMLDLTLAEQLMAALLKKDFQPWQQVPAKAIETDHPDLVEAFRDFQMALSSLHDQLNGLNLIERTRAIYDFAAHFLPAIHAEKQRLGVLEFDDLITKTRELFSDRGLSDWILYRIDGGVDHLLVDEAQDTSPAQWKIIEHLTQELRAGKGSREDTHRSIFVVGDPKQSIYSFQGAAPGEFSAQQQFFDDALAQIETQLQSHALTYSFRSSAAILKAVDATFATAGTNPFWQGTAHEAFKSDLPGRVDIWPWIEPEEEEEKGHWYEPVDRIRATAPSVHLASKICDFIAGQLKDGQITVSKFEDGAHTLITRAVEPKDFLILVRKRNAVFTQLIKELKSRGLPLAGADRLKLTEELAVKDLLALLSFLSNPKDDYALAVVLRSPLLGLSEDDLFRLAHGRTGTLFEALQKAAERFDDALTCLKDLMGKSDFLRPFELIDRVLTHHQGRDRLLGRLGEEAAESIEALLSEALNYERSEAPSLTGFLKWITADDIEIKRQVESDQNLIRVMTVHGAKGLEAPIVILPISSQKNPTDKRPLVEEGGMVLARGAKAQQTPVEVSNSQAAIADISEEDRRLLYVAMTRAENWLVLCGGGSLDRGLTRPWYDAVTDGLKSLDAAHCDTVMRYQYGAWPDRRATHAEEPSTPKALAAYFQTPIKNPPRPVQTLSPSDLGGAKIIFADDAPAAELDAAELGTAVHKLLEVLPIMPQTDWDNLGQKILQQFPQLIIDVALAQARAVLSDQAIFDAVFAQGMSEVNITGHLNGDPGKPVLGAIDRLIIADDRVLAVDFKTNQLPAATPAQVPEGILRQMAAYHACLTQIYPDKTVKTAILWTTSGNLMVLPQDIVTKTLQNLNPS